MANKYIRHGETYCGDGTTSAAATSTGGVGAWNNINVLAGTAPAYGALAAGDTVFIRSKDAAGADITVTLAASIVFGSSAGVSGNPVTFILDAGTVWPGVDGTLTYNCPSTYVITVRDYNRLIADRAEAIKIVETNTSASYKNYSVGQSCHVKNVYWDFSLATSNNGSQIGVVGHLTIIENPRIKAGKIPENMFRSVSYCVCQIVNPDIELTVTPGGFVANSYQHMEIFGGQVRGAAATTGASVFYLYGDYGSIKSYGFTWPRTMTTFNFSFPNSASCRLECVGADGGMGAVFAEYWGSADSRTDNYYPTLSATFANSTNTPWSWRVYPQYANKSRSMRMVVGKMFTESAATKTITMELLVADSFAGLDQSTLWMDVEYIDNSTGLRKCLSTQNFQSSALAPSTASWSAVTYGAISLLKLKLSITCPTSIKQDTMVMVTLRSTATPSSANDIFFLDPDVSIL